ncbi:hypothetical protein X975_20139, partial [Stegodyphus mimosarum]
MHQKLDNCNSVFCLKTLFFFFFLIYSELMFNFLSWYSTCLFIS